MKQSYTIEQITKALCKLESEGLAIRLPEKSKTSTGKIKASKKPMKISAIPRRGNYSILDGLAVGESRDLYGNSKHKVFSAIARRARTHCCEKYSCAPVAGAFEVTREE